MLIFLSFGSSGFSVLAAAANISVWCNCWPTILKVFLNIFSFLLLAGFVIFASVYGIIYDVTAAFEFF